MIDWRSPGAILLLATYELGHQPLSLAWPAAVLTAAGYAPRVVDLAVEPLEPAMVAAARFVALATPMHTALRLAVPVVERLRALNPTAYRCAYGLYAGLNANYLLGEGLVHGVLSGEIEAELLALVQRLEAGAPVAAPVSPAPIRQRLTLPLPERHCLPALDRYARLLWQGEARLAGTAESSRGCRHTCRHCPLTPIYGGRFFAVPVATVLADIRQQVAAGAQHITFTDPDFLNGPTHARRVVQALHAEFPTLTFDATIKIEHLLQHVALLPELRTAGCLFIVSAVESLSDEVLRRLAKGHTRADIDVALSALDAVGIALRPSLLPFTPWTTLADYRELLDWIEAEGLVEHIDPVHLSIRLLIPPGSAILDDPTATDWLGELDAANFSYRWHHPDPRLDALQQMVAAIVEAAERDQQPAAATLEQIRSTTATLTGPVLQRRGGAGLLVRQRPTPPRLTESWFC